MAAYTILTTSRQDAVSLKLLPRINADRVARGLPTLNLLQLAQLLYSDTMGMYIKNDDDDEALKVSTAFTAASPGIQAAVRTQLGL